jgi:oxalate decarboxylase/phosphoglucose isomerase-like protein (cupin superfamily)
MEMGKLYIDVKNMKVNLEDIGGEIIRDNETYVVQDNQLLNNLVLSQTRLKPEKETTGHSHEGLEEIYFFNSGYGKMMLGEEIIYVNPGDIVLIPSGVFHKVFNTSFDELIFTCVFQYYKR